MTKTKWICSVILLSTVALSGCATTSISRILADPHRYRQREVHVEGNVTNVIGALNAGVYQVDDGTGKIFVVSGRGIPGKGTHVKVSGTVTEGVNIMGKSFGTSIQEHGHKVKF
ncbi:MAG: hypothetical protein ABJF23_04635 [Bryobacteraceae bacterium]